MNIDELQKAARQARAALDAARGKAAIAVAEAACAEACRALAAAKRAAAEPAPAVDMAAVIARHREAEQAAELRRRVKHAAGLYMAAQEWPRCGQRWPASEAERKADMLIREHGSSMFCDGWEE